jgi:hypothetical protein
MLYLSQKNDICACVSVLLYSFELRKLARNTDLACDSVWCSLSIRLRTSVFSLLDVELSHFAISVIKCFFERDNQTRKSCKSLIYSYARGYAAVYSKHDVFVFTCSSNLV